MLLEKVPLLLKDEITIEISNYNGEFQWADDLVKSLNEQKANQILPEYSPRKDYQLVNNAANYMKSLLKQRDLIEKIQEIPTDYLSLEQHSQEDLIDILQFCKELIELEGDDMLLQKMIKDDEVIDNQIQQNIDRIRSILMEINTRLRMY
jgi:hypothetical protein